MTARLSRETALELLLAVAGQPYESRRCEWGLVMRAAGIKLSDIPAFQAAIAHSNWKAADNPIGYLLTVAAREARALRRDGKRAEYVERLVARGGRPKGLGLHPLDLRPWPPCYANR